MNCAYGGIVRRVLPGSLGQEVGIEPGDILKAINGHCLRDVIDYRFYADDEELELVVEREGVEHILEIERDPEEYLGLEFTEMVFDGIRLCRNKCEFCFVAQLRPGLRRSLYVRDDDYRYSFLSASYVTLTNLTDEDWARLEEQRLSPLYVSVHATDVETRRTLLGRADAPDVMAQLQRLGELDIRVHCQVVICPGRNDGAVLERTIKDLASLWPIVQTLALVPVGLTRFHRGDVRRLNAAEAGEVIRLADRAAQDIRRKTGHSWVYPSDELYLLSGADIPSQAFYDNDAQYGNGVGMVRDLLDEWQRDRPALSRRKARFARVVFATGELVAPVMTRLAREASALFGIQIIVCPVKNRFLGEMVTVAGLLSGQDVVAALCGIDADVVCVPRSMFDQEGKLTLDDMTWTEFCTQIGRPVFRGEGFSDMIEFLTDKEVPID